jgi:voltage-gated potassium channel Kch
VVVTLLSGTHFYRNVEGWSLPDAFYFSAITLTTVGFGDLSPSTAVGKLFTVLYLFVGIGLILVFISAVARRMLEIQGDRRPRKPRDEDDKGRSGP